MIGAMPAVAVRHERRKQEKRGKRPSMLQLHGGGGGLGGGLGSAGGGSGGGGGGGAAGRVAEAAAGAGPGAAQLKHPSPPSRGSSPAPSPLASPPSHHDDLAAAMPPEEFYVCGKVSVLHVVVVSLLLGAILLVVGLVQLKPGADASAHRYYLLAAGGVLMALGLVLTALRCWLLPRRERRLGLRLGLGGLGLETHRLAPAARRLPPRLRKDDSQAAALTAGAGPCACSCAGGEAALDAVLVNTAADDDTPSLDLHGDGVGGDGGGSPPPALRSPPASLPTSPPPPPDAGGEPAPAFAPAPGHAPGHAANGPTAPGPGPAGDT
ncbi:hypothetical protein R5R35_001444 [Gryllus longicercus]|uniref:Uncharacterized protein n=1 Tax=Gryllus longicercus TaxID=2509291 RepID=A0AAN9VI32_9ORTH